MRRGDRRSGEECPHYAYGIHTELCRTVWDTGWQGILKWVLDATQRYKEKPVHQQETVVQPASERGWDLGIWGRGGRGGRDQTTCKSKSEVQPPLKKIWEFIPFKLMKKKEREIFLGFCENAKNAFKLAYLWGRFFFFLISARQGVTITEICESGWKFWRKHLSTCRQVKLELNVWCSPVTSATPC